MSTTSNVGQVPNERDKDQLVIQLNESKKDDDLGQEINEDFLFDGEPEIKLTNSVAWQYPLSHMLYSTLH